MCTKPSTPDADCTFGRRLAQLKGSSAKKRLVFRNPTDEMFKRWLKNLSMSVPTVDLSDLSNELAKVNSKKRQFAPELS